MIYKPIDFEDKLLDYPAMARSMHLNIPHEFIDEKLPYPHMLLEAVDRMIFVLRQQKFIIDKYEEEVKYCKQNIRTAFV